MSKVKDKDAFARLDEMRDSIASTLSDAGDLETAIVVCIGAASKRFCVSGADVWRGYERAKSDIIAKMRQSATN